MSKENPNMKINPINDEVILPGEMTDVQAQNMMLQTRKQTYKNRELERVKAAEAARLSVCPAFGPVTFKGVYAMKTVDADGKEYDPEGNKEAIYDSRFNKKITFLCNGGEISLETDFIPESEIPDPKGRHSPKQGDRYLIAFTLSEKSTDVQTFNRDDPKRPNVAKKMTWTPKGLLRAKFLPRQELGFD